MSLYRIRVLFSPDSWCCPSREPSRSVFFHYLTPSILLFTSLKQNFGFVTFRPLTPDTHISGKEIPEKSTRNFTPVLVPGQERTVPVTTRLPGRLFCVSRNLSHDSFNSPGTFGDPYNGSSMISRPVHRINRNSIYESWNVFIKPMTYLFGRLLL